MTRRGWDVPRAPANRPAAQPAAAPFQGSCVCRILATYVSVKANVAATAAAKEHEPLAPQFCPELQPSYIPKKPMVPPPRVKTPIAPRLCFSSAVWTEAITKPTPAPWRASFAASFTAERGSKTISETAVCSFPVDGVPDIFERGIEPRVSVGGRERDELSGIAEKT